MSKLDWMYKSSNTVDPEEYLLGRSIDKNYENPKSSHNEVDKDILPTSIFAGANSNVQVDVFRKKKEDPLEQIKQKEIEMRKQLLKNPVKLKKLQSLLKAKEEKKSQKDKKKKKKSKDKDIDDLLAKKYMKLINKYGAKHLVELTKSDDSDEDMKMRKNRPKRRASSSSSSPSSGDERSSRRRKVSPRRKESSKTEESSKKKNKRRSRSRGSDKGSSRRRSRSRSRENDLAVREKLGSRKNRLSQSPHRVEEVGRRRFGPEARDDRKSRHQPQRQRSTSSSERSANEQDETAELLERRAAGMKDYDYSSDEGKSKFKKAFGLVLPKGVEAKPRSTSSESRCDVKVSTAKPNKYVRPKPTRLTEEEKQAKLKEMVEDAQKWEQTRKSKVNKYREEQKKEDAQEKKFDGEFMRKELSKATSKSVAERIKSNINNLQRSKFSMDQHFAKRT